MKRLKKWLALGLVTVMAVSVFAGCGSSSDTESSSSSDSDVLVMATAPDFPPYEYIEGSDCAGIDVEIAQAIADKLGKTLEIEEAEFGSIIAGVTTGKYDMGMSGITVTEDRKESVNFSDPYTTAIQSIIVTEDSAITSVDDLSSETLIGVQQDTTGDIYATDDYGTDAVVRYKTGADAVQAVLTGKVDCVIIDNQPAKNFVEANEGLKILETAYVEEEYAIALNKDDEELLEQVNNALNELKQDGTIDEIVAKYITD